MHTAALLANIQLIVFAVLAALLLLVPSLAIRALGLPAAPHPFWPRLVGALLVGMIVSTLAADQRWTTSGLGLGGYIAINFVIAFTLISQLVVGADMPTRRGRFLLWCLALLLAVLAFAEIAIAT